MLMTCSGQGGGVDKVIIRNHLDGGGGGVLGTNYIIISK